MRKLVLALLATLVVAAAPTQASAQSLGSLLNSFTGNSSSYGSNTIDDYRRQEADRQRQIFDRRAQQISALQRACQAGDQESCIRSGGVNSKQMDVARALMDACVSGDRSSCARANAMVDERNMQAAGYQQQRGAPQGYAQQGYGQQSAQNQGCQPVYDRSGYRIAGVCR